MVLICLSFKTAILFQGYYIDLFFQSLMLLLEVTDGLQSHICPDALCLARESRPLKASLQYSSVYFPAPVAIGERHLLPSTDSLLQNCTGHRW